MAAPLSEGPGTASSDRRSVAKILRQQEGATAGPPWLRMKLCQWRHSVLLVKGLQRLSMNTVSQASSAFSSACNNTWRGPSR